MVDRARDPSPLSVVTLRAGQRFGWSDARRFVWLMLACSLPPAPHHRSQQSKEKTGLVRADDISVLYSVDGMDRALFTQSMYKVILRRKSPNDSRSHRATTACLQRRGLVSNVKANPPWPPPSQTTDDGQPKKRMEPQTRGRRLQSHCRINRSAARGEHIHMQTAARPAPRQISL